MLTLRNYSKSFNDRLILKIDNLTFKPGAYWIKGDNGSGKSTLFKCLAGILPCQGDITFVDDVDIRKNPVEFRKRINYSEAEPQYPGFLTAKDIFKFIAKIKGASQDEQADYVQLFGLTSFFENPCETYSSGMIKKLGLALAFLGKPKVIILDEPLITLDQQAREILFGFIRKKIEENITLLISSHHSIALNDFKINDAYLVENKTLNLL
ncbi:MAG TPA: ABC transporter ATP-binding protein [Cyclobacteriaceae bacterium]|nr:ABC transporter ATP-binding protein [Cyclobacteriaceae bacterium]